MTNPEQSSPQYNLWVDCEFTGLSLEDDYLLEVGAVVTEGFFTPVDTYASVVAHNQNDVFNRMMHDDWWPSRPDHTRLMLGSIASSRTNLSQLDEELVAFTAPYFEGPIVPIGSSPARDRQFIERDLPLFNSNLHYRTIDVSSFKETARRLGVTEFPKRGEHRTIADIEESMHEFQYLLKKLGEPAVQSFIR